MTLKHKAAIFVLATTMVATPFMTNHALAEEPVSRELESTTVQIKDPELKKYLNGLLKQPADADITQAQMDTITTVSLANGAYTDLSGLEKAHNLTGLTLNNTSNITDYSLVTSMSSLQTLYLSGQHLTDAIFPNLNGLTNLNSLSVSNTSNTNAVFAKLNQLPSLTYLYVQNTMTITDISALASLPELKTLFVQFNGIKDLQCISEFPKLETLAATGQNTGRMDAVNKVKSSVFTYNETAETLFIPFSMMPNRFTHFDGYKPPFTTSASSSQTYLAFNDERVDNSRLSIDGSGIIVNGVTKQAFDQLESMEYNARYDNAAGSYATPSFLKNYSASSGTYDQYFAIDHFINITADEAITYAENQAVTEAQFLEDIHAETDDGSFVTSNFDDVVDTSKPGTYEVTLNARNEAGLQATPVKVMVTVVAKSVITADPEISYKVGEEKEVAQFLRDVNAKTNDGSAVLADFEQKVDMLAPGTYWVTLNATNDKGLQAEPVRVKVIVEDKEVEPVVTPVEPTDPNVPDDEGTPTTPAEDPGEIPNETTNEVPNENVNEKPDVPAGAVQENKTPAKESQGAANEVGKQDTVKNEVETSKMNPTNKAQTAKEKNTNTLQREKNSLPKTGDKALGLASILGGTLVLLAGVILFRRKKA